MTLEKLFSKQIDRRGFLRKTGQAALAVSLGLEFILSGCATFDTKKDWSQLPPEEFDIKAFDKWFRRKKLYNGRNPNLRRPHYKFETFRDCAFSSHGATPGVSYSVPWGEVMVAAADGEVISIQYLKTGRAGGLDLWVHHYGDVREKALRDGSVIPGAPYESHYAHLNKVFVESGDHVKRGDPIGNVTEHRRYAKLMLMEEGNLVDPDNYGPGHSFMNYWDGSLNLEINDIDDRIRKQTSLLHKLYESYLVDDNKELFKKLHCKRDFGYCWWSLVEKFRYLEELYEVNPGLFPNLSKDHFKSMKKDFYDNQPIILTLPFVKGGMKKYK